MAKPKLVNWQIIEETELYDVVGGLIKQYHGGDKSIEGVNYILMWRLNVKMDQDDYVLLTDITRSPDKMRELRPHDVVIGINKDAWSILDETQQDVVIDAQLERIAVCLDKEDNPKEDDRSRTVYRLRRPEVLDEATLQRRHGTTMQDVQDYVRDKFNTGNAEEGSYVADQLTDTDRLSEEIIPSGDEDGGDADTFPQ